jgi:hypothetical protein
MKYWYKLVLLLNRIIFNNRSYSVLLNNINGASFEEVKEQLKGMKVTVFNRTDEGYFVRFTRFIQSTFCHLHHVIRSNVSNLSIGKT